MTKKQTKLPVVEETPKQATTLTAQITPMIVGDQNEDFICGKCNVVLAENVSRQTIFHRITVPNQLLLKCPKCGALNRLASGVAN